MKLCQKRSFVCFCNLGEFTISERGHIQYWILSEESNHICWVYASIFYLYQISASLFPFLNVSANICSYINLPLSLREAVLYQNWCFFTHCVNGPWPPPPRGFTQSCCWFFDMTVKKCWTSIGTKYHIIVQKSVEHMSNLP